MSKLARALTLVAMLGGHEPGRHDRHRPGPHQ